MGARPSLEEQLEDSIYDLRSFIRQVDRNKEKSIQRQKTAIKKIRKSIKGGDYHTAGIYATTAIDERKNCMRLTKTVVQLEKLVNHIEYNVSMTNVSANLAYTTGLLNQITEMVGLTRNSTNFDRTVDDINVRIKYFEDIMDNSSVMTQKNDEDMETSQEAKDLLNQLILEEGGVGIDDLPNLEELRESVNI